MRYAETGYNLEIDLSPGSIEKVETDRNAPVRPGHGTERFKLIHEYQRRPCFDPDLPEELLPKDWLRSKASNVFYEYHDIKAEKANKYFDSVLKAY